MSSAGEQANKTNQNLTYIDCSGLDRLNCSLWAHITIPCPFFFICSATAKHLLNWMDGRDSGETRWCLPKETFTFTSYFKVFAWTIVASQAKITNWMSATLATIEPSQPTLGLTSWFNKSHVKSNHHKEHHCTSLLLLGKQCGSHQPHTTRGINVIISLIVMQVIAMHIVYALSTRSLTHSLLAYLIFLSLFYVVYTSAVKKEDCWIHFDYGRSCDLSITFCFCFVFYDWCLLIFLSVFKCKKLRSVVTSKSRFIYFVDKCLYFSCRNFFKISSFRAYWRESTGRYTIYGFIIVISSG